MNSWIILFLAGICEIVWGLALKVSEGFTKPLPIAITIIFSTLSIWLLGLAAKHIPLSISYTIWVGIGGCGIFLGSMLFLHEKTSLLQICFCFLILVGVVGIKLTSNSYH